MQIAMPGRGRMWSWVLIALLLMLLPTLASGVRAAPPLINIGSEPLTVACRAATPAAGARMAGTSLLVTATVGVAASSGPPPASPLAGDLLSATLDAGDSGGHFERSSLPPAGMAVPGTVLWDAGAILTGAPGRPPLPAPDARNLYTAIVQGDGRLSGIPFTWPDLSAAQQAMLDQAPPPHAASDGLGERRVAYLRGDRGDEGALFRRRSSVLGDSINSTPVLVGPPSGAALDADYTAFRERNKARRPMIYLGANDGMLHGFDAGSGIERYAYLPDALISALNRLPSPSYVHRAYVDGPAISGDAVIAGNWRTVLISAMGGGAQGLFALDVTDPEALNAASALWEFTDRDDPMMGNLTTLPQIAKVRTGHGGEAASDRYLAVATSGLNNYASDGHSSRNGKGALFLLALDKPSDAPWKLNANYYRWTTPISDSTMANGLSAPALAFDRDGALSYAYAGDLQGNLWRFDFAGWPSVAVQALFTARDADGRRQPIAQRPMLAYATGGGYMVLFGTGVLFDRTDLSAGGFVTQSFYGIHDSLSVPMDVVAGRRQLTERVLGASSANLFNLSGAEIAPGSKGWYVDFLQSSHTGERSIGSGALAGGAVVFNTLLPGPDKCDASRSRTYVLNALTGLPEGRSTASIDPTKPIVGLLQPTYPTLVALVPQSSSRSAPDPTGQVVVAKNYAVANVSAGEVAVAGEVKVRLRAGRLSWREVANWRELHEAIK
ncbi:pilus assembly protein PilY [Rugamonas sp. FT81W]|uniref:Pilus assembly protein PilY n=1 Tax=Duganella vulcania TaxID=2692166 RepID=A0A845GK95_9BURK|nr:PilC/PilY family type IV pilus protein [Duganella vulcania]MYM93900.1 pilus assembly protein PilY [Duganella vulcania]